jgi:hypothetical protein
VGIGEWPQNHGIDDGKDGGVGPDAQGQYQHRNGRESGSTTKRAQPVTDIAREIVD